MTLVILVLVGSAIARPNFKDERLNFNKERVCGYEVSTLRISVTNLPYQRKKNSRELLFFLTLIKGHQQYFDNR